MWEVTTARTLLSCLCFAGSTASAFLHSWVKLGRRRGESLTFHAMHSLSRAGERANSFMSSHVRDHGPQCTLHTLHTADTYVMGVGPGPPSRYPRMGGCP
ncbi:hypothetical protein O6H91_05G018100 [Diphasiastrum complanatum]|uniref:Uncharacterized protein n=1 Tax=Diphasiastrum complanatum TaxID=34168 RepID=A0ACC2DL22_DIPCM|nr:hypothetical protein O6H91_05G018100 [Diphasiastrum complanatum]